jgi:hypothetical protein
MFRRHKVYKHKNNSDVAFLVTNINDDYVQESGIYLRGFWMRITPMNTLHELASDSITVQSKDVGDWHEYEGEQA